MAWTLDDLQAIDEAIAQGAMEVEYEDKRVKFMSLDQMLRARRIIINSLGLANTDPCKGRKLAQFSKGLKP